LTIAHGEVSECGGATGDPSRPSRQIAACRESQQAEAQDNQAFLPRSDAEKPQWDQERNGPGYRAEQGQVEDCTAD
jgi:hypothetical protein